MKYRRFTDNTVKTVFFINISGYRIRPSHYRQHNLDCFRYHYDRLSNTAWATDNTTMAAFAINITDSNTDLGLSENQSYCQAIYNTAEASVRLGQNISILSFSKSKYVKLRFRQKEIVNLEDTYLDGLKPNFGRRSSMNCSLGM